MTIFQGAILGIVQGIGEFLPISSSGHLILIPWILGWDDGGLTFDVALHFGTLIALLIYFRREWVMFTRAIFKLRPRHFNGSNGELRSDKELFLAVSILIATIPGAIMGLLLEKKAEHAFRAPALVASTLAIMGVILWVVDKRGKKSKGLSGMSMMDGLLIGIGQGFAVIPGVSRAGVTISVGLMEGLDRDAAARFSFFLSMPIIAGACILKLRHLTGADITGPFVAGVVAAAISGYLAIGGLIKFLQTRSYGAFAVYRVVAGLAVLSLVLTRHF